MKPSLQGQKLCDTSGMAVATDRKLSLLSCSVFKSCAEASSYFEQIEWFRYEIYCPSNRDTFHTLFNCGSLTSLSRTLRQPLGLSRKIRDEHISLPTEGVAYALILFTDRSNDRTAAYQVTWSKVRTVPTIFICRFFCLGLDVRTKHLPRGSIRLCYRDERCKAWRDHCCY